MSHFSLFLIKSLAIIIAINIIGLWCVVVVQQRRIGAVQTELHQVTSYTKPFTESFSDNVQKNSTMSASVEEQVEDLTERVGVLESKKSTPSNSSAESPKEVIVFIGTGSSHDTSWKSVDSAVVTIDTANYPNLKEVRFEAALSILSGNGYARLIDQSSGTVLTSSTVMNNTSTSTWITSAPVQLLSGNHTYVVQLMSSSNEFVNLAGSRLRIKF